MFSTLLNGVKLERDKSELRVDQIQAVFLPKPTAKSKSIYPYNPEDGGKLKGLRRK